jgi:hypothetical protein
MLLFWKLWRRYHLALREYIALVQLAGRVNLALHGLHTKKLRVVGHLALFWLWLLQSYCTLRCSLGV